MSHTDTYIGTHTGTSTGRRDPLYELEMCRALLHQATTTATATGNPNPVLIRGLEREIARWKERCIQGCVEPAEPTSAI